VNETIKRPRITASRAATPFERYWELEAEKAIRGALPAIRSTATKWAATIGTLTGIFGIAALIKGRENIAELTRGFEIAVGVLVALALVLSVIAVLLAALAAQGSVKGVRDGPSLRALYASQMRTAHLQLSFSRATAVVAVLVLVVAIGMTWYGPAQALSPQSVTVLATTRGGETFCGTLVISGSELLGIKSGKALHSIKAGDIVTLAPVSACP
jgi:hypothetical protein